MNSSCGWTGYVESEGRYNTMFREARFILVLTTSEQETATAWAVPWETQVPPFARRRCHGRIISEQTRSSGSGTFVLRKPHIIVHSDRPQYNRPQDHAGSRGVGPRYTEGKRRCIHDQQLYAVVNRYFIPAFLRAAPVLQLSTNRDRRYGG